MTFTRMKDTKLRKAQILDAALRLAVKKRYDQITRDEIAAEAGCSSGLITHRYGTMVQLRRDLMRRAVKESVLLVIGQGLAAGDAHARRAPEDVKQKALAALA
jgi:AcrR family transcriptional regulator